MDIENCKLGTPVWILGHVSALELSDSTAMVAIPNTDGSSEEVWVRVAALAPVTFTAPAAGAPLTAEDRPARRIVGPWRPPAEKP